MASSSGGEQPPEEELIRVVAAVVSRGGELLVCQRPLHKRHGGLWEFPGGKCEPGESDEDALRRELREELRVELVKTGETHLEVRDKGSPFVIAFIAVTVEGEALPIEHSALRWGSPHALREMPLAPADRLFLDQYASGIR